MKSWRMLIALLGAAAFFASAVVAAPANKTTLNTSEKLTVDGKPLAPGTYKVEWEGSGPAVQVKLLRGKDTVATFPAQLADGGVQNAATAYGTNPESDGTRSLIAIYVGGSHNVLQVQSNAASTSSTNSPQAK